MSLDLSLLRSFVVKDTFDRLARFCHYRYGIRDQLELEEDEHPSVTPAEILMAAGLQVTFIPKEAPLEDEFLDFDLEDLNLFLEVVSEKIDKHQGVIINTNCLKKRVTVLGLWDTEDEDLGTVVWRAAKCAHSITKHPHKYPFKVHCYVAAGEICSFWVGNLKFHNLLVGPLMDQFEKTEGLYAGYKQNKKKKSGKRNKSKSIQASHLLSDFLSTTILTPQAWALIKGCTGKPAFPNEVDKIGNYHHILLESIGNYISNRVACVNAQEIDSVLIRENERNEEFFNQMKQNLRRFIPSYCLNKIEACVLDDDHQNGLNSYEQHARLKTMTCAELRRVVIIQMTFPQLSSDKYCKFVERHVRNGVSNSGDGAGPLCVLQNLVEHIQFLLQGYEGHLVSLSANNEGTKATMMFGLFPLCHEDDALRAVKCAEDLKIISEASKIAVITDTILCSIVGNKSLRTFVTIGNNMAWDSIARMEMAELEILVDQETYNIANHLSGEKFSFEKFEVTTDGKDSSEVEILYKLSCQVVGRTISMKRRLGSCTSPRKGIRENERTIARAKERRFLEHKLFKLLDKNEGCVVVIEGEAGMGKTNLVNHILLRARRQGLQTSYGIADQRRQPSPFCVWKRIFRKMLQQEVKQIQQQEQDQKEQQQKEQCKQEEKQKKEQQEQQDQKQLEMQYLEQQQKEKQQIKSCPQPPESSPQPIQKPSKSALHLSGLENLREQPQDEIFYQSDPIVDDEVYYCEGSWKIDSDIVYNYYENPDDQFWQMTNPKSGFTEETNELETKEIFQGDKVNLDFYIGDPEYYYDNYHYLKNMSGGDAEDDFFYIDPAQDRVPEMIMSNDSVATARIKSEDDDTDAIERYVLEQLRLDNKEYMAPLLNDFLSISFPENTHTQEMSPEAAIVATMDLLEYLMFDPLETPRVIVLENAHRFHPSSWTLATRIMKFASVLLVITTRELFDPQQQAALEKLKSATKSTTDSHNRKRRSIHTEVPVENSHRPKQKSKTSSLNALLNEELNGNARNGFVTGANSSLDLKEPELSVPFYHLKLEPLNMEKLIELVNHRLGYRLAPENLFPLFESTQGHPLLCLEMANSLKNVGVLGPQHPAVSGSPRMRKSDLSMIIPSTPSGLLWKSISFSSTLQRVIATTMDQLKPSEKLTLQVASVLGDCFDVKILLDIHPKSHNLDQIMKDLHVLCNIQLIHPSSFLENGKLKQDQTEKARKTKLKQERKSKMQRLRRSRQTDKWKRKSNEKQKGSRLLQLSCQRSKKDTTEENTGKEKLRKKKPKETKSINTSANSASKKKLRQKQNQKQNQQATKFKNGNVGLFEGVNWPPLYPYPSRSSVASSGYSSGSSFIDVRSSGQSSNSSYRSNSSSSLLMFDEEDVDVFEETFSFDDRELSHENLLASAMSTELSKDSLPFDGSTNSFAKFFYYLCCENFDKEKVEIEKERKYFFASFHSHSSAKEGSKEEYKTRYFRFDHHITRETINNTIVFGQRRKYHVDIAKWYEKELLNEIDAPDSISLCYYNFLAHHYSKGGLIEEAVKYYIKAGTMAYKLEAIYHAAKFFKEAINQERELTQYNCTKSDPTASNINTDVRPNIDDSYHDSTTTNDDNIETNLNTDTTDKDLSGNIQDQYDIDLTNSRDKIVPRTKVVPTKQHSNSYYNIHLDFHYHSKKHHNKFHNKNKTNKHTDTHHHKVNHENNDGNINNKTNIITHNLDKIIKHENNIDTTHDDADYCIVDENTNKDTYTKNDINTHNPNKLEHENHNNLEAERSYIAVGKLNVTEKVEWLRKAANTFLLLGKLDVAESYLKESLFLLSLYTENTHGDNQPVSELLAHPHTVECSPDNSGDYKHSRIIKEDKSCSSDETKVNSLGSNDSDGSITFLSSFLPSSNSIFFHHQIITEILTYLTLHVKFGSIHWKKKKLESPPAPVAEMELRSRCYLLMSEIKFRNDDFSESFSCSFKAMKSGDVAVCPSEMLAVTYSEMLKTTLFLVPLKSYSKQLSLLTIELMKKARFFESGSTSPVTAKTPRQEKVKESNKIKTPLRTRLRRSASNTPTRRRKRVRTCSDLSKTRSSPDRNDLRKKLTNSAGTRKPVSLQLKEKEEQDPCFPSSVFTTSSSSPFFSSFSKDKKESFVKILLNLCNYYLTSGKFGYIEAIMNFIIFDEDTSKTNHNDNIDSTVDHNTDTKNKIFGDLSKKKKEEILDMYLLFLLVRNDFPTIVNFMNSVTKKLVNNNHIYNKLYISKLNTTTTVNSDNCIKNSNSINCKNNEDDKDRRNNLLQFLLSSSSFSYVSCILPALHMIYSDQLKDAYLLLKSFRVTGASATILRFITSSLVHWKDGDFSAAQHDILLALEQMKEKSFSNRTSLGIYWYDFEIQCIALDICIAFAERECMKKDRMKEKRKGIQGIVDIMKKCEECRRKEEGQVEPVGDKDAGGTPRFCWFCCDKYSYLSPQTKTKELPNVACHYQIFRSSDWMRRACQILKSMSRFKKVYTISKIRQHRIKATLKCMVGKSATKMFKSVLRQAKKLGLKYEKARIFYCIAKNRAYQEQREHQKQTDGDLDFEKQKQKMKFGSLDFSDNSTNSKDGGWYVGDDDSSDDSAYGSLSLPSFLTSSSSSVSTTLSNSGNLSLSSLRNQLSNSGGLSALSSIRSTITTSSTSSTISSSSFSSQFPASLCFLLKAKKNMSPHSSSYFVSLA